MKYTGLLSTDAHVSLFCYFCVTCTFDTKYGESNLLRDVTAGS